jgi:fibronectin type 3 domain-containing protein
MTEACSVSLSAPATSPTLVTLSSNKSALQVPSSVTVSKGATSVPFSAKTSIVAALMTVTLTASSNGVSLTDVFQLLGASSSQPATSTASVQLSWDAPGETSDPVTGYHVYRSTGSNSSDYSMLSSLDTQTSFIDSTVQSGSTYEYIVKSVDANGVESKPSNSTTITVP